MKPQKLKSIFLQSATTITGICTSETKFLASNGYDLCFYPEAQVVTVTKEGVTAIVPMANVKVGALSNEQLTEAKPN